MYITHINIEAALNINITKSAGFVAFNTVFINTHQSCYYEYAVISVYHYCDYLLN